MTFSHLTRSWDLSTLPGPQEGEVTDWPHTLVSLLSKGMGCLSSWHILLPLETGNQSRVSDYLQHCISRSTLVNAFHWWRRCRLPGAGEQGRTQLSCWPLWDDQAEEEEDRQGHGRAELTSVHSWAARVSWKVNDSYAKAYWRGR